MIRSSVFETGKYKNMKALRFLIDRNTRYNQAIAKQLYKLPVSNGHGKIFVIALGTYSNIINLTIVFSTFSRTKAW